MSQTQPVVPDPLEWDLADRLAKAMRIGGYRATTLAAVLGVHRNTVSNYLSGKIAPDRRTLIAWASECGVPMRWLETGIADTQMAPTEGEGHAVRRQGLEPRTR